MRILSQDRMGEMWDIPYGIAVITCSEHIEGRYRIYAQGTFAGTNPNENFIQIAEYSTEAKAKRAMEMLRTAYAGRFITNADISEDFNEQLKELMKGGFGTVLVKETNDSKIEFNNLNGYFQFPADDELEG